MKKIDLVQTIGLLANIGVIGGLVFVGMQLQQDRDLASIDRRLAYSDARKYWAEILTTNSEVWVKGITGQPLTPVESIEFDALAKALDNELWTAWANSQNQAFDITPDMDVSELRRSFIRQAAREYASNPGLLNWYREYQEGLRAIGQYGEFEELVNEEIDNFLSQHILE